VVHSRRFFLDQFSPVGVYNKIRKAYKEEVKFIFESAGEGDGNVSFIFVGASERLVFRDGKSIYMDEEGEVSEVDPNPFGFLKRYYTLLDQEAFREKTAELDVGFVDGFIGYIGYDTVQVFEPVLVEAMANLKDGIDVPDIDLIRPKFTIAYSHKTHQVTLISPFQEFADQFNSITTLLKGAYTYEPIKSINKIEEGKFSFDKSTFMDMVDRSKEMIASGDVFQVLMANRYTQPCDVDPFSFYRVLRTKNPSPYMFFMEYEDFAIAGSSPEVMVRLSDGEILLRPIAGTRKRGKTPARDLEMEKELLADDKERAEHLMLIDLGRNDVGRVAKQGSVHVEAMMHIERFSHVMHMVSDVKATIADGHDMFDLFAATFTAGTMTGAPKIRAMEIIAEFEGIKRGFYSGSVGYFGFDGNMDSSITIRTALIKDEHIYLQAGAGVVADSQPELEFLEVQNKLGALKSSLEELQNLE
jgi:anthranilate synthase component 1